MKILNDNEDFFDTLEDLRAFIGQDLLGFFIY